MLNLRDALSSMSERELTLLELQEELQTIYEKYFEQLPSEVGPRELFEIIQQRGWCIPVRLGIVRIQITPPTRNVVAA